MNNIQGIQGLIDVANSLCRTLDETANNEKNLCIDIQMRFEQMSWECLRMADELREIKNYVG